MMKNYPVFAAILTWILLASTLLTGAATKKDARARISMAQAREIAAGTVHGRFKSSELEVENGKAIYSFDIRAKDGLHEVNIDAKTGAVLENKIETPADEMKEKAADQNAPTARQP